jgi:hypothetical protein
MNVAKMNAAAATAVQVAAKFVRISVRHSAGREEFFEFFYPDI